MSGQRCRDQDDCLARVAAAFLIITVAAAVGLAAFAAMTHGGLV